MQQRQLRLGDILDDYCPRERRLTNHVVVAMIGADVKQTRCSTCETEHEYKQAKLPRLRRKADAPVLAAPAAPVAPMVSPSQAPTASPNLPGGNDAPSRSLPSLRQTVRPISPTPSRPTRTMPIQAATTKGPCTAR